MTTDWPIHTSLVVSLVQRSVGDVYHVSANNRAPRIRHSVDSKHKIAQSISVCLQLRSKFYRLNLYTLRGNLSLVNVEYLWFCTILQTICYKMMYIYDFNAFFSVYTRSVFNVSLSLLCVPFPGSTRSKGIREASGTLYAVHFIIIFDTCKYVSPLTRINISQEYKFK